MSVAPGVGVGSVFSVALCNLALRMGVGIAIGAVIGVAMSARK